MIASLALIGALAATTDGPAFRFVVRVQPGQTVTVGANAPPGWLAAFCTSYRTNVQLYPHWQTFLRRNQPKMIIFWGQTTSFLRAKVASRTSKTCLMRKCIG
jgi:hypothetical protein